MGKNKVMTNILTKSSIATKLWVWFLIVAAVPLVIVGMLTNYSSIETIKTEVSNRLNSVAESKTELINNYFKWMLEDVKILSENLSVIEASEKFTEVFEKHGLKSSEYKVIDKEFRRFLTYYKEGRGYSDILFISKAGDVVFTLMHEPDFGTNLITGPYKDSELANVFSNAYTLMETEVSDFKYYPPAAEPASFIASPVRKEGEFIGVIAFQIDTRAMNKLAQDFTGLGETGEIVISAKINNGAMVLTPLRHDHDAAFKRIIPMGSELSIPAQKAVQGQKGSGIFKDYRGEEVLAVWRYLPYLRWGVVVKIDVGEAYAPIHKLTIRFLAVGIISAFVLLFISFFLSKSISKPIKRLHEGVEIIATGNLNHVVGLTTKDEIGQLSRSFDRMVVNLKNINADLIKEISERKQAEQELHESEARYRAFFETSRDCVFITSVAGRWLYMNDAAVDLFGYASREQLSQVNISDHYANPEERTKFIGIIVERGYTKEFPVDLRRKDGAVIHALITAVPRYDADGNVTGFQGTIRDITERKRAEESLTLFRSLMEQSNDAVEVVDPETARLLDANEKACAELGYTRDEFLSLKIHDIDPIVDKSAFPKIMAELRKSGSMMLGSLHHRKDGTTFPVEVSLRYVQLGRDYVVAIVRDITERKRSEEAMRASLAEKEVLLKEVHHRVKNNLMTIIGLIKMQETKADNEMFTPLLQELEGRVRAMALVHESLHKSESLARIDLQNYIETMSSHIRAQFGLERDIRFSVLAAGVEADLDIAVSCGLILNEMISNAYKHAFPAGKTRSGKGDCEISVTMKRKGGACILTVADNGVGLPEVLNLENPETLGLRLIKMLSKQLNGSIEVDRSAGTTFRLRFAHSSGAS